jgi:hypothetical protein
MYVLGIDSDVSKMSICLIDKETGRLVDSLDADRSLKYFRKTRQFYDELGAFVESYSGSILLAGIEDYGAQLQLNNQARKGGVVDCLELCLLQHDIPIMFWYPAKRKGKATYCSERVVGPSQLTKFIFGSGKVPSKGKSSRLMLEVYKQTGYEFKTDDLCDAFMIAQMMRVYLKFRCSSIPILPFILPIEGDDCVPDHKLYISEKKLEPIIEWIKYATYDGANSAEVA